MRGMHDAGGINQVQLPPKKKKKLEQNVSMDFVYTNKSWHLTDEKVVKNPVCSLRSWHESLCGSYKKVQCEIEAFSAGTS